MNLKSNLDLFIDNIYSLCRKTAVVGAGYIAVELAGILQVLGSDTSLFIRREQVSAVCGEREMRDQEKRRRWKRGRRKLDTLIWKK